LYLSQDKESSTPKGIRSFWRHLASELPSSRLASISHFVSFTGAAVTTFCVDSHGFELDFLERASSRSRAFSRTPLRQAPLHGHLRIPAAAVAGSPQCVPVPIVECKFLSVTACQMCARGLPAKAGHKCTRGSAFGIPVADGSDTGNGQARELNFSPPRWHSPDSDASANR
jgi:hypothetical protein